MKRRCKKGYPCGRSCINKGKNCRNRLSGQGRNYADFLNGKNPGYAIVGRVDFDFETRLRGNRISIIEEDDNGRRFERSLMATRYQEFPDPSGIPGLAFGINRRVGDAAVAIAGSPNRVLFYQTSNPEMTKGLETSGLLKNGDVVILRDRFGYIEGESRLTKIPGEFFEGGTVPRPIEDYSFGVFERGSIRPLTQQEMSRVDVGKKARELRREQSLAIVDEFRDMEPVSEIYPREDRLARQADDLEDRWLGRKNRPLGEEGTYEYWEQQAREWRKKQGFEEGGAANGFTAEQTAAHDIVHPITHRMLGMNSRQIHAFLGGAMDNDGKPSLIGEEAIVNVVEHLSRGDSFEASLVNGLRLARVLSRTGSEEERRIVRTLGFRDALAELTERVYRADNYRDFMRLARQSNRISKTVQALGDDFTNSASGG